MKSTVCLLDFGKTTCRSNSRCSEYGDLGDQIECLSILGQFYLLNDV